MVWHHGEAADRFKDSHKWSTLGKAMSSDEERPWRHPPRRWLARRSNECRRMGKADSAEKPLVFEKNRFRGPPKHSNPRGI